MRGAIFIAVLLVGCGPEFAPNAHLPDGQPIAHEDAGTVITDDMDAGPFDAGSPDAGRHDAGFDGGPGYALYVSGCIPCTTSPDNCPRYGGYCETRSVIYSGFCARDCQTDDDCPSDAYCDDLNSFQGRICYPKNTTQCMAK